VILAGLVDRVCRRLGAAHRMCRTVTLRLRFDDFTHATRGHTLPQPTAETDAVLARAENSVRAGESRDARCPRTAGSSPCYSTGMAMARCSSRHDDRLCCCDWPI
jgi:nucleotidyltransferase/DNA polymerase involved in DNA repair